MPTPRQYDSPADRQRAYRARCEEARLKQLAEKNLPAMPVVATIPGKVRWTAMHEQIKILIQKMADEMQDYHDNCSEKWQESEKGETFQTRLENVQELLDAVDSLDLA